LPTASTAFVSYGSSEHENDTTREPVKLQAL
jgi:hypothetical protein